MIIKSRMASLILVFGFVFTTFIDTSIVKEHVNNSIPVVSSKVLVMEEETKEVIFETLAYEPETEEVIEVEPETEEVIEIEPETEEVIFEKETVSKKDIELIALLTMAEAEGEPEKGKRLVIDTVLNRIDSKCFPDTAHGVIYQKNQFSAMWNGRVDRCEATEELVSLVTEELENRSNSDVIFFTAGKYGKYGNPMFRVGNHYFASY